MQITMNIITSAIEHMRDAHHELMLGLLHYMCGVAKGTVTIGIGVGNKSWLRGAKLAIMLL